MHYLGWSVVVLVVTVLVINAAVMLVSPRAWFRLAGWLRAQGTLPEKQYGAGWGALQLRIGGGVVLATIAWILYDSLR